MSVKKIKIYRQESWRTRLKRVWVTSHEVIDQWEKRLERTTGIDWKGWTTDNEEEKIERLFEGGVEGEEDCKSFPIQAIEFLFPQETCVSDERRAMTMDDAKGKQSGPTLHQQKRLSEGFRVRERERIRLFKTFAFRRRVVEWMSLSSSALRLFFH